MNYRALCFVDMPFGQKSDLKSGVLVDFDQIYNEAIKPAIEECGLDALRGDEERTGGIIHSAMFVRLLLSEFSLSIAPFGPIRSRIRSMVHKLKENLHRN
jgi:hypothetical protein